MTTFAVVIAGLGYYGSNYDDNFLITKYLPIKLGLQDAEAFRLVGASISKSGNIIISIPNELKGSKDLEKMVMFIPKIEGKWLSSEKKDKLVYKPAKYMEVGSYYKILMETEKGDYSESFKVDEDPKILSILPRGDTEVHEDSEITIIFNRPMVPMTTLDVAEAWDIPVDITPTTEGEWKWISTRTLQFTPTTTLVPSANYTVKIRSDFKSADQVSVSGIDHQFMTRNLKLLERESKKSKNIVYNKPVEIKFNQPIDLDRTAASLKLSKGEKDIPFTFEYGFKITEKKEKKEDKSIMLIFNKENSSGRLGFWDTEIDYKIELETAYPLDGNINMEKNYSFVFGVTDIIFKISAKSDNSSLVSSNLFDPKGSLIIQFYEDVDILRSVIKSDVMKSFDYGQKCENEYISLDSDNCKKIDDYSKIEIEFYSNKMSRGKEYKIFLETIMNRDNIQINADVLPVTINVLPEPKTFRTISNEKNFELKSIKFCTNIPLKVLEKKYYTRQITANNAYKIFFWGDSFLAKDSRNSKCDEGQFQTDLSVGLDPFTDYKFEFKLEDSFGENIDIQMEFSTDDVNTIDLGIYNVLDRYTVTVPDKTKIIYASKNLDYVDVSLCKVDAYDLLYALESRSLDRYKSPEAITSCLKTGSEKVYIKTDYWKRDYFYVNLDKYFDNIIGHYIVTLSNPKMISQYGEKKQIYIRSYISVTNMSIVESKVENWNMNYDKALNLTDDQSKDLNNLYWVTKIDDMSAVTDADVKLFKSSAEWASKDDFTLNGVAKYKTDKRGIVEAESFKNLAGVIVRKGDDSAIISNASTKFERNLSGMNDYKYYIYSDRPIYRPGDRVNLKGLYRSGYDGNYEFNSGEKKIITLFDSTYNQIAEREVVINEFGTFSLYFELGNDYSLGQYSIEIDDRGVYYFDVEEYKPAPFKIDISSTKDEFIAEDILNLAVNADYYFGADVEVEEIEYSIVSQNYYFDRYDGEYYSFNDMSDCQWDCYSGDKFILRDYVDTSEQKDIYYIEQKLDFEKFFEEEKDRTSKIFIVNVTVKNTDGQFVSAKKSFIVHQGEFYLGIKTDKYFVGKKEKFNIKVQSVDINGKEKSIGGAKITVNKVDWIQNKRQEVDGGYYNRWKKQLKTVKTISVNTNKKGQWNKEIELLEEGEYILTLERKINNKNYVKSSVYIYVFGDGYVEIKNGNNSKLDIVVNKRDLSVGDKGNIVIKSPYDNAKALIKFVRGDIYSYEIVDISQNLYKYDFEVIDKYYPNIYLSVVLLSDKPEVKYGRVEFNVSSLINTLDIEVTTNKENYLPGENVEVDIKVTDLKGDPVRADLSLAVVDMSVLALKGNKKKNPVEYFYGGFPLTVSVSSNLKNLLYEIDIEDKTKGGGGARMMADALEKKKRGEFRDTAYWISNLSTDMTGVGKSTFTLPDNLTTWQLELIAISEDTKLASEYKEIVTKKNVMAEPLMPRFIVSGDEFKIGTKVFNQTEKDTDMKIWFSSPSLNLEGKDNIDISIDANSDETVYFEVSAPLNVSLKEHIFTIKVKSDEFEDSFEKSISIKDNDTYEYVSHASYSDDTNIAEYIYLPDNIVKDKGSVAIRSNATLANFLSDALDSLISYPYGGTEQISSKLYAIAILSDSLGSVEMKDMLPNEIVYNDEIYTIDELVEIGIDQIMEMQNVDGSFSYYKWIDGNYYLSLHVLDTLIALDKAGFSVSDELIDLSYSYIFDRYENDLEISGNQGATIQTASVLSKLKPLSSFYKLTTRIKEIADSDAYIEDGISSLSLVTLAQILFENSDVFMPDTIDKIFNSLDNRLRIDSRGSYLGIVGDRFANYYETPIKNTALLLKTYLMTDKEPVIVDQIVRWIISSQSKDGSWGSTHSTLAVINAMSTFLKKTSEMNAEFDVTIDINNKEESKYTFGKDNVFSDNILYLNLQNLSFGGLNKIEFNKTDLNGEQNRLYYDIVLKYFLPITSIQPRDEGFLVSRELYSFEDKELTSPLKKAKVGDVIRGQLKIVNPDWRKFVTIEDFIPAGTEIINFDLDTADSSILLEEEVKYSLTFLNADYIEYRDDRIFVFVENLAPGEYKIDYFLRVSVPGKFIHLPAIVKESYFPENFGRTKGDYFIVETMK